MLLFENVNGQTINNLRIIIKKCFIFVNKTDNLLIL